MDTESLDIEKTLQYLTLDEKKRMLSGEGMWHTYGAGELPRVRMSDGPNGLRVTPDVQTPALPAVCYPTQSMLANSWDPALLYAIGAAIGKEATAMGVNLLLAPGLNIKRDPRGGRNFEYYSEDPLLSGALGKAFVSGVQSTGVGACIKHFAANNQEGYRMYSDSVVDARALRELYLRSFEIALESEPAAVMCAYNKLNGVYCSENEFLLKNILREEFNFNGVTVSDWGAVHSRVRSLLAGLDLEMPDPLGVREEELTAAIKEGKLTEANIDASLRHTLKLIDDVYLEPYGDYDADEHDRLCYNAAVEGTVLLKNDKNFLPLTRNMKVAVVGDFSVEYPIQGGGSSHVTPVKTMSPLEAYVYRSISVTHYRGFSPDPKENSKLYDETMTAATGVDAIIVYAGVPASTEGLDRKTLELPKEQNDLISALVNAGHRVIVVINSPGPVLMPWIKRVRSVIYSGLNGQNGALAAVDVIYGRVNPRGKLAETFPADESELDPDFGGKRALYKESIFVGYRYYDTIKRRVLFPFGHGLSFSEISYDSMRIRRIGNIGFEAEVKLTNRSVRDAHEIVQIYVSDMTGTIMTPEKQLAGFAKVFIEGETTTAVTIKLDPRVFMFYDRKRGCYAISDGQHKIICAASAADPRIEVSVDIAGDIREREEFPPAYRVPVRSGISDADFEKLYGAPLPPERADPKKGEFTLDCCIEDISRTFAGKIAMLAVRSRAKKLLAGGITDREAFMVSATQTPLSAAAAMSGGAMSVDLARGLVAMANGKFFKGLGLMLKKSGSK